MEVPKIKMCVKKKIKQISCQIKPKLDHYNSQLGLYLRGRITLRELFCLREDEGYLVGKGNNLETVFIDDNEKDSKIMDSLQCGSLFYPEITLSMRGNITADAIMERVNSEFIRGLAEVPESDMTESRYLEIL